MGLVLLSLTPVAQFEKFFFDKTLRLDYVHTGNDTAEIYSIDASTRPAGGDLGWFPQGFLLWPELDQAVFELNPGDLSNVVQTQLGYHLIELLERGEHQLDYQTRLYLQEQAVEGWLINQKEVKDIQVFIES